MTQEEKKLLYKDLSARQPYRPFVCFAGKLTMPFLDVIASTESNELMSINGFTPEYVKPYLRPMSSMTEEEKKEIKALGAEFSPLNSIRFRIDESENDGFEYGYQWLDIFDFLNKHHFDYRGLIPIGLALEAPEDMYKTE